MKKAPERRTLTCDKCGWVWHPRGEETKMCPYCKAYLVKPTKPAAGNLAKRSEAAQDDDEKEDDYVTYARRFVTHQ